MKTNAKVFMAILFILMYIMPLSINAQRCAVLDFQVGTNITEEEVDGFTYTFRSNFNPANYTVVERMTVNQVVNGYGYTRTDMTRQQMLRVARELEASVVIIGTVNKFLDEYSVDIQAINVASGTTIATEGATFQKSEYKTKLSTIASNLMGKLANGTVTSTLASKQVPAGYTDLSLPSGTIWKNYNATGFYTYDEAVSQFGNRLPTKAQWEELKTECQWKWTGSGYKVIGPNGNYIELPAEGWYLCNVSGHHLVGSHGIYWSSTSGSSEYAWSLYFSLGSVDMDGGLQCNRQSVRLVHD